MRRYFQEGRLGQIFAFAVCVVFVSIGGLLAFHGHEWSGAALGTAGLTGVITAFIGQRQRSQIANSEPNKADSTPGRR